MNSFEVFFLLQLLLLVICFYSGYKIKNNNFLNLYVLLFVISFTLIEGLRFGRGIDYNIYYQSFQVFDSSNMQGSSAILFDSLRLICKKCELPYQCIIIISSFLLAISGIKLLVQYPQILFLSLPWFYLVTFSAENLFRWYAGFSFILLGIPYLFKEKSYMYALFCLLGVGFHLMMSVPALLFYIISKAKTALLSPLVAISIYVFLSLIWSSSSMKNIIAPVNYVLSFWEHYNDVYGGSNLSAWLDGSHHGLAESSIIRQLIELLKNSFLIVLGHKLLIYFNSKDFTYFYNCMLLGIISYPAFAPIELMDRFVQLFLFFQCIVGGYIIYCTYEVQQFKQYAIISVIIVVILAQGFYKRFTPSNKYYTYYVFNTPIKEFIPVDRLIKGY